MTIDFLAELRWRGLLKDCTDPVGLAKHLADPAASPRRAYVGFDPSADSLTIGNLVPIMMLVHFARAGHQPVVVMGGGTGLIGDPSGKSAERTLMTDDTIASHVRAQRPIFENVFAGAGLSAPKIVNNADWLTKMSAIELLRDVGKHFSVNQMMAKESVRERLHNREQGISYTEFSYMILQAYDFLHLFETDGVTIQMGGSDQYGNITAGADLIRRTVERRAEARYQAEHGQSLDDAARIEGAAVAGYSERWFGLTTPLVAKADGGKFGKTEEGAVWLTGPRTTAYAMYQFWLNASDEDAIKFLKLFTLLSQSEIESIERAHAAEPFKREAQKILAIQTTTLVHGKAEAEAALRASQALFSGDIAGLPMEMLEQVFAEVPSTDHPCAQLEGGIDLVDVLIETSLAKSKREAREFVGNGSVSINGSKAEPDAKLTEADLLHGKVIALRRGKKAWHLTRWG